MQQVKKKLPEHYVNPRFTENAQRLLAIESSYIWTNQKIALNDPGKFNLAAVKSY
jgi:hypothetical protein